MPHDRLPAHAPSPGAQTMAPQGDAGGMLELAPVAMLQVAAGGTVCWANAAARAWRGQAGAGIGERLARWLGAADDTTLRGRVPCSADLAQPAGGRLRVASQPLPTGGWLLVLQPIDAPAAAAGLAQPAAPPPPAGVAESQLALAVDLGGIAIWRHDLATQRMHYNAQAYAVLAIPPRPEGLSIDEVRALIHPDDLPQVVASAQAALASDRPTDMEARYLRSDGSWRHVMTRRMVQRDSTGQAIAFLGVALDVTERIEQTRRANALTRRFELVTRSAGIGYWSLEPGAAHAHWSPELCDLFGVAADAQPPTQQEWFDHFVHPADRAAVKAAHAEWMRSGRVNLDLGMRIVRPDGQVRQIVGHSRRESEGEAPLIFGVIVDITEQRSAEQALRGALEQAALAARGAGLGTWEMDLQTDTNFWDEQMWVLRGLAPRPQSPSAAERVALLHPDDRVRTEQAVKQAIAAGTTLHIEFRVVWPDGRVRWLASRSVEVRDAVSGTARRIGVNWDVTDSRTAEAVRREREIALRESAAKSKFLARMSHELRTPLNAVLGFAQLLLADERPRGVEETSGGRAFPHDTDADTDAASATRRRRLEHIRAAGQHLLTLINDVLDLASLEGGELRIALQPVALAPLVAGTLPLLEPLLHSHRVAVHVGPLELAVMADATRLRQVLLNLLSNAIKYNRAGGEVRIEALARGDGVVLRVSDSGRGMSLEQVRHLFEPFNRLGIASEAIEGSGIGLAIVKTLVERMGGSVHVDSRVGTGSVFELRLAAAAAMPAEGAPPAAAPPAAAGTVGTAAATSARRRQLLYIEDNPVNALIISELLARRSDLALHVAVDGASGVAAALELRPDLILLDMQLPDADGFEVLRRLRADPATAGIACIALSANAMPEDIERALQAGLADYWTKPLDFNAFTASLDALFGKAAAP